MARISEIMTRDVVVVRPDDSIEQAAQCMKDLDIGSVPVCDGRKLLGMVTDRDITTRAVAAGVPTATTHVVSVMSKDLRWCTEDEEAADVLDGMGEHQIRRLPVINEQRELVGIVSLGDLATRQGTPVNETLRDISRPAQARR